MQAICKPRRCGVVLLKIKVKFRLSGRISAVAKTPVYLPLPDEQHPSLPDQQSTFHQTPPPATYD
jgi:hypothetical protein